jgi:hypothetical protein
MANFARKSKFTYQIEEFQNQKLLYKKCRNLRVQSKRLRVKLQGDQKIKADWGFYYKVPKVQG